MNKTTTTLIAAALLAAIAAPAQAQAQHRDGWTGGYLGLHAGRATDPDDDGGDRFLFDTDLDGAHDDTVRTVAGADAFSPGFCNGAARTALPADGCTRNEGGADWGIRGGYDWQVGHWVFGVLAEYAMNDVRDAVSAYSTTPAYYTMYRKVDGMFAVRGRAGWVFGDASENLLYATAGWARADIDTAFTTSNGANAFADNGDSDADGHQLGVGYERRIGAQWSIGVEYVLTRLDDDDYRVRVSQGSAPPTNPFLIVNPDGTDLRRSDRDFDFDAVRVTAAWRF